MVMADGQAEAEQFHQSPAVRMRQAMQDAIRPKRLVSTARPPGITTKLNRLELALARPRQPIPIAANRKAEDQGIIAQRVEQHGKPITISGGTARERAGGKTGQHNEAQRERQPESDGGDEARRIRCRRGSWPKTAR